METTNKDQFWLSVAEQLGRFRLGEITKQELIDLFPELKIEDGWRMYDSIKEAIDWTVPQECPLSLVPKIVIAACKEEQENVNHVNLHVQVAFQPEWLNLRQVGELEQSCRQKMPITFFRVGVLKSSKTGNLFVELRDCIKEGSRGDEDGFDVGSDTWLVGILKEDGTWLLNWHLEC
ncbi:MAG: hypothetical protein KBT27_11240 [Prevotellaceae bacterium]|nr:hypothetical protein [Candidatus Faecinaster equi]